MILFILHIFYTTDKCDRRLATSLVVICSGCVCVCKGVTMRASHQYNRSAEIVGWVNNHWCCLMCILSLHRVTGDKSFDHWVSQWAHELIVKSLGSKRYATPCRGDSDHFLMFLYVFPQLGYTWRLLLVSSRMWCKPTGMWFAAASLHICISEHVTEARTDKTTTTTEVVLKRRS